VYLPAVNPSGRRPELVIVFDVGGIDGDERSRDVSASAASVASVDSASATSAAGAGDCTRLARRELTSLCEAVA
jgi:hypothetical protein